ncbi:SIMPL domain-containing protein [Sphingomonas sp. CJ20]
MTRAILLAAALAGAGAGALPAAAQDARVTAVPIDGTVLEIAAEGSTTRTPDVAILQAGVVTQAATAAEAMTQNGARMTAVLAALRRAGIAERDIQTATINLSPQYRYQDNQPPVITGYQASNQVTVRFRDVAKSGGILDILVREGANNIAGPNLTLDKPEAALDEARTDAIAKARARATLYAKAAGLRVDRILSITESGASAPGPVPVMMTARRELADSATPIAAGEREMTVSVSVRFLLK